MLKKKTYEKTPVDFVLGKKYRDKFTGFIGIAVAKREMLNGTIQLHIEPEVDKEGKMNKGYYIDVGQLVEISSERPVIPAGAGGPTTEVHRD